MQSETIKYQFMQFRLKEVMAEKSISNVDLAKMLGYTTVAISNMVTGKTLPSIKTLEKISELTDVPTWQFFVDPKVMQEQNRNEAHITCPHCGKEVCVSITAK